MKENFRQEYIIDFVKGRATDDIVSHKHDNLEEFGAGEDMDAKVWNPVIRQALIAGYLKKDVENYGLLKLTAAGKRYLKNPTSFMIVADKEFKDDYVESAHEGSNNGEALDPTLFAMLKDLRKSVAKSASCHHTSSSRMYRWSRWLPCIRTTCRSCRTSRAWELVRQSVMARNSVS